MNALLRGRIVFVLPGFSLGGAERQALHLARYLFNETGVDVHVCGMGVPGPVSDLCEKYGLPWSSVKLDWPKGKVQRLLALKQFALALRQLRPEILLPYCIAPNVFCGLIWPHTGAQLCVWNQRDAGLYFSGSCLERWAVRRTPRFIANSQHGADFLVRTFSIQPQRVRVIHNGVQLEKPQFDSSEWRARLKLPETAILAIMVANLHSLKDHGTLLKTWRLVLDRLTASEIPPVLLLAGAFGDMHNALKALAYDLELGKGVRFLGRVDDIAGLLGAADLGVFSSRNEGCPNGLLECMAAGLPVVATDIPGIREVVSPVDSRQLVPVDEVEGFADVLVALIGDSAWRESLGHANQAHIRDAFGYERMCRDTWNVLMTWLE